MADIYERNLKWRKDIEKSCKKSAKILEQKEVEACTFNPTVNDKVAASLQPKLRTDSHSRAHVERQEKGRIQKKHVQERTEWRCDVASQSNSDQSCATRPPPPTHSPSRKKERRRSSETHNNGMRSYSFDEQKPTNPRLSQETELKRPEKSSSPVRTVTEDSSPAVNVETDSQSQSSETLLSFTDRDLDQPPKDSPIRDSFDAQNSASKKGHQRSFSAPNTSLTIGPQTAENSQVALLQQLSELFDHDLKENISDSAIDEEETFFVQLQRERREWQKERMKLLSVIESQQRELEKRKIAVEEKADMIASSLSKSMAELEHRMGDIERELRLQQHRPPSQNVLQNQMAEMLEKMNLTLERMNSHAYSSGQNS